MGPTSRRALLTCLLVLPLLPSRAAAHRDDYLDETFVYQTLARNEFELELWAETREAADRTTRGWYTAAFEYGCTSRWTLDAAAQAVDLDRRVDLGRLRVETRYRFAEEGAWPLDVALSSEFEHERGDVAEGEGENVLTPRIVVSRDVIRELNTTLNLDFPIQLEGGGGARFAYALGLRVPAETLVRVGLELKGQPSDQTATLFPQLWLALPSELTIKGGTGIGLTSRTDRFVGRLVLEKEF